MRRWLVIYSTAEGQTARIAAHIAQELGDDFVDVAVRNVTNVTTAELERLDGVVIGASIHGGHHSRQIERFVRENLTTLQEVRSGFYSVSLSAASADPIGLADARAMAAKFLARCGWEPDAVGIFAGAVKFEQYGKVKRMLVSRVARREGTVIDKKREREYTDWREVHQFVAELVQDPQMSN